MITSDVKAYANDSFRRVDYKGLKLAVIYYICALERRFEGDVSEHSVDTFYNLARHRYEPTLVDYNLLEEVKGLLFEVEAYYSGKELNFNSVIANNFSKLITEISEHIDLPLNVVVEVVRRIFKETPPIVNPS